jgi:hypothetical protein
MLQLNNRKMNKINKEYQVLTLYEQILIRPDSYVGTI